MILHDPATCIIILYLAGGALATTPPLYPSQHGFPSSGPLPPALCTSIMLVHLSPATVPRCTPAPSSIQPPDSLFALVTHLSTLCLILSCRLLVGAMGILSSQGMRLLHQRCVHASGPHEFTRGVLNA